MPQNKNQHFVPRCALKPFSLDGAGFAINLFNISRTLAIKSAPLKSQCARDYLYGKGNTSAEGLLARLEGQYARIMANLSASGELSEADKDWLRLFIAIQQRRTEAAIKQMRELRRSMAETIFAHAPEQLPANDETDTQMMFMSLRLGLQFKKYIDDLKLVVFVNGTAIDFVTSDHPAIMTNRYHLQKLNQNSFGMANSGALITMPLTPRLSLMAYDTNVYTIPNASGTSTVALNRRADINALNQIQYLSADRNIYFQSWNDADRIASEIGEVAKVRASAGASSKTFVRDYSGDGAGEVYRTGSAEEEAAARETIVTTSFRQPVPISWPSVLKYRSKPRTFSNGSAVGHLRKAEWLEARD
jgi:hypothetical protein